jgi:hypothetical protein
VLARAINLLVQNHKQPNEEYQFPISHELSEACEGLRLAFSEAKSKGLQPPEEEEKEGDDEDEAVLDDDEFLVHSNVARDSEDADPGPLPDSPQQLPCKGRKGVISMCPIIQPKLHALLFEIYRALPTDDNRGQFYNVLMRFLLLSSLTPNGEWIPSRKITQHIAALLFGARLVMFSEIHRDVSNHGGTYHR